MLAGKPISERRAASSSTPTQCSRCGAPRSGESRCRKCGHEPREWRALAVVVFVLGTLALVVFVDGLTSAADIATMFVLLLGGLGMISAGLELTPDEHARKPSVSEEGFEFLWIAHRLPLRLARAWNVLFGLILLALPLAADFVGILTLIVSVWR
jgi:hypothetical protein